MWWIYLRGLQKIQNRILYCFASDEHSFRTTNETLNRYFILCEFPCVVHIVPTIIIKILNVLERYATKNKKWKFYVCHKIRERNVMDNVSSELNNNQFERSAQDS